MSGHSPPIAATHYQLGITQGFDIKYAEAVVCLEAAIAVLEANIDNLKAEKESTDDSQEGREKITDTNEMKDGNIRRMKE